jgi:hypothetical protein
MAVKFTPSGNLDVATDPAELPEIKGSVLTGDKGVASGAMTRCTNLSLDRSGMASTRAGTSKLNATALQYSINELTETSGDRYSFAWRDIYKNETSLISDLGTGSWSTLVYKAFNSVTDAVFGLNGTDRKRIEGSTVSEWGIDAPADAAELHKSWTWCYTYDWEALAGAFQIIEDFTDDNNDACTQAWEIPYCDAEEITDYTGDNDEAYTGGAWEKVYAATGSYDAFLLQEENYTGTFYSLYLWENGYRECYADDGLDPYVAIPLQYECYFADGICTYSWEQIEEPGSTMLVSVDDQLDGYLRKYTTTHGDYEIMFDWEGETLDVDESTFPHAYSSEWMYWFEQMLSDSASEFRVVYTYCRKLADVLECESNPSPEGSMTFDSGGVVLYTAPTDPQVTHVRIYRSLADESVYYYHSEIPITETYEILSKRDTQLGSEVLYDHDRPPLGTVVAGPNYDGSCFIIHANNLYYCKPKQPEYWPALYYVEVSRPDDDLVAVAYVGTGAYVASGNQIYHIQGTGVNSFFPLPMGAQTGTKAKRCFCPVQGQGIFHLGYDGIYQFKIGSDVKISDAEFKPIFAGEAVGSIPGLNRTYIANCWMIQYRGKLWFGYPGGDDQYPGDVLVTDLNTKRTTHISYPFLTRTVAYDSVNDRLLSGGFDGFVRVLDDTTTGTDSGTAVAWEIESKEFGGLRKYFPRFARYDVAVGDGGTCNGYILLDGEIKQTHAITESRKTKKRLVAGCAGDRMSLRLSGTGVVDIYAMEAE